MFYIPTFEPSMLAPENSCGYRLNISHPAISPLYNRYKKSIGAATFPISDAERHAFEKPFLDCWERCAKRDIHARLAEAGR